jgi:hypothetical protein
MLGVKLAVSLGVVSCCDKQEKKQHATRSMRHRPTADPTVERGGLAGAGGRAQRRYRLRHRHRHRHRRRAAGVHRGQTCLRSGRWPTTAGAGRARCQASCRLASRDPEEESTVDGRRATCGRSRVGGETSWTEWECRFPRPGSRPDVDPREPRNIPQNQSSNHQTEGDDGDAPAPSADSSAHVA